MIESATVQSLQLEGMFPTLPVVEKIDTYEQDREPEAKKYNSFEFNFKQYEASVYSSFLANSMAVESSSNASIGVEDSTPKTKDATPKQLDPDQISSIQQSQGAASTKRKKKTITGCPHTTREHYSKGMCKYCYNYFGRVSLATKCAHPERMVYSHGKCRKCYVNGRNAEKRAAQKQEEEEQEGENLV